jgi:hypothetical protein
MSIEATVDVVSDSSLVVLERESLAIKLLVIIMR